jgi:hypothetical protein
VTEFEWCRSCVGSGFRTCTECKCRHCNSIGMALFACPSCNGTRWINCGRCRGRGCLRRRFWFFGERALCPECEGSRGHDCACGTGKVSARCSFCEGGRSKRCARCRSTGKRLCLVCKGSGQAHSEWFTSLGGLTIEQLQTERETRLNSITKGESEIRSLVSEIERLTLRLGALEQQPQGILGQECVSSQVEGGTSRAVNNLRDAISQLASRLAAARHTVCEVREEVSVILKVVRGKATSRPCKCGGSNENCRYCYGSGTIG